jgi:hypothetical protein
MGRLSGRPFLFAPSSLSKVKKMLRAKKLSGESAEPVVARKEGFLRLQQRSLLEV